MQRKEQLIMINKEISIESCGGEKVGYAKIDIYENRAEARKRFLPFFDEIFEQLVPPVGEFMQIEVFEEHRRQGFGFKGLNIVNTEFERHGVKTAILSVAWFGEEPAEIAIARRVRLYERAGWRRIEFGTSEYAPILMIRDFTG